MVRQSPHKNESLSGSAGFPGDPDALLRFSQHLKKAAEKRHAWAERQGIFCYRVYDAEVLPYTISIDIYRGAAEFTGHTYAVISHYRRAESIDPAVEDALFTEAVQCASQVLDISPDCIFEKARHHDRAGAHYKDGMREPFVMYTQESGYLFEVDLRGHLDTGIFLDHRPVRERIGQMAEGSRFLNLFAYTGTATVHAAGAKAESTTTVDLSQTYVNWAKRNIEHNGFAGEQHRFVRSDALQWLDREIRKGATYDLVFADPPTFSRSKLKGKKTWSVARDHVELLTKIKAVLSPQGKALFSCNLRDFKPNTAALAQEGVALEDITKQTIPEDFEQNPQIHRCFLVQAV